MKKLISLFVLAVVLFACSKTESPNPEELGQGTDPALKGKPGGGSGGGTLVVTTYQVSNISRFNATAGGSVSKSGGGSQVTERGVCYSTSPGPTTSDNKVALGSGYGSFSTVLMGLSPNTLYYVRAYAVKDNITTYGNEVNFTTVAASFGFYGTVTDFDGNTYDAYTIGTQVWMVDNLKTTHYRDGSSIENFTGDWYSITSGAYCDYNDDPSNSAVYGRLYNWYAVNDSRNLAPEGYHVATGDDWAALLAYFGGALVAASNLKEFGTAHWFDPNVAYPNESNFNALPGGLRSGTAYGQLTIRGSWWSSTGIPGTENAKYCRMHSLEKSTYGSFGIGDALGWNNKHHGYSVLCVKD